MHFEDERQGLWLENSMYPILDEAGQVVKVAVYSRDITRRKEAEQALRRYAQRLEKINQIDRTILENQDATVIMQQALEHLRDFIPAYGASIVAFDFEHKSWTVMAGTEGEKLWLEALRLPLETFGHLNVLQQGQVNVVNDLAHLPTLSISDRTMLAQGLRSYISVPLHTGERLVGALNFSARTENLFTDEHIEIASQVATTLALFLEQTRLRAEREKALDEIVRLNAQLEQRVLERTAQLEAANRELDAFSYSVSHDLRAPLRAMDGFSRILLETYMPQLPPEAQRYVRLVCDNAQQMGRLVDDLLSFARLGRRPLDRQPVETANLVRRALESLGGERAGRNIEITIGELPACQGDPRLLHQVWVNLMSNALKFTRGREVVRIEIGCEEKDGEPVYFIRDNGAGFDMRYANKLFGVFQRLHTPRSMRARVWAWRLCSASSCATAGGCGPRPSRIAAPRSGSLWG